MNEQTIKLSGVSALPNKKIHYDHYDRLDYFTDPSGRVLFESRTVRNEGKLLDLHDFMPWGWGLDFPILREFNVAVAKLYGGNVAFYSMRNIKINLNKNEGQTFLEQLADKWLEIYSLGGGPKDILLTGASLGALFCMIIASRAKAFGINVPHVYLNEPAGVVPKTITQIRRQTTRDTKFEFEHYRKQLRKNPKVDIVKYLMGNLSNELKIIRDVEKGNLATYVNKYLLETNGNVHIFHGASSSFITDKDLALLNPKINHPNRVNYSHIVGLKHGVGPHFMELATWCIRYIAQTQ